MILADKYELLGDFSTANSGNGRWGFVQNIHTGEELFIKEFLSPKYPMTTGPGTEESKAKQKIEAKLFEERQEKLKDKISEKTSVKGNLIITLDFFREETMYYKVTEKIDIAGLEIEELSKLSLDEKLILLKTIAHSLKILHDLNILHADLKPDNILIKKTSYGVYTTKLIDFDDSFFVDDIPSNITGSWEYLAPEMVTYMDTNDSTSINLTSDIYALGLIYCQYITGSFPTFDKTKYSYPWEHSLESSKELTVNDKDMPDNLKNIINKMLLSDSRERININTLHGELKKVDVSSKDESIATTTSTDISKKTDKTPIKLQGDLIRRLEEKEEKRRKASDDLLDYFKKK